MEKNYVVLARSSPLYLTLSRIHKCLIHKYIFKSLWIERSVSDHVWDDAQPEYQASTIHTCGVPSSYTEESRTCPADSVYPVSPAWGLVEECYTCPSSFGAATINPVFDPLQCPAHSPRRIRT